jgi:5,10-methylene-tetrahydrofolate dehydrogenase/methenyl tetrahydrofolate cyclohydrolase
MLKILYQNIFLPKILGKSSAQTCQKYIKKEKEKKKEKEGERPRLACAYVAI